MKGVVLVLLTSHFSCLCPISPILQQEDLQYPLDSSTLPKLEEFYISLIKSQQSAEGSQPEPESIQTQPKHNLLSSVVPSSAPAGLDSPETHSGSGRFAYPAHAQLTSRKLAMLLTPPCLEKHT